MSFSMNQISLLITFCVCSPLLCWNIEYDPDVDLDLNSLAEKFGFGVASYTTTTQDGYIIQVDRVVQNNSESKVPIILVHGMSACADSFFAIKNYSLPILLAHNGYDVWLMNSRGTIKSSKHVRWNATTDREFWAFSWQEMGLYDLPASIDLVLQHNNHERVALVGHSEGSTVIFVLLSDRPEYNEKVFLAFHFGVSVYNERCSQVPILQVICGFHREFKAITDFLGIYSCILPHTREFLVQACKYDVFKAACYEGAKFALQSDEQISHITDWSFILSKVMCGCGLREVYHYMQVGSTGKFARYDHGRMRNLQLYNSTEPPLFHLENVKSPLVLWCGTKDIFCTDENLAKLMPQLTGPIASTKFSGDKALSHIDLIVGKSFLTHLFKDMLRLLKKYQ